MTEKNIFDMLDFDPEDIPEETVVRDTGTDIGRIDRLISAGTAAGGKKPKMRFVKKFLLIAAAIVAVGSLTAAVVMKFIDFNMDEPVNLEMRKEIIEEEQREYYDVLYNELDKYSDVNADVWDKYKYDDRITRESYGKLSKDISVSAYDTMIRNDSRRILDILKKYDRIGRDTTPEDVCDTYIKRVMLTDEDTEKYCDYVRACVDLFYDDNITEKERVYLELFLEKALVVTHGAVRLKPNNNLDLDSEKLSCWVITRFGNTVERSEDSNKKINETYDLIYNTIKRTLGKYNPDNAETIINRANELNIYIDDEKIKTGYDRFKFCLLLSDIDNCSDEADFIKYNEMQKKYNETHDHDEAYEEMRKELARIIDEEIPTREEYNEFFENVKENDQYEYDRPIPDKFVNADYYFDYVEALAGLKNGEDCFRTMQNTLDRFNVRYDCTTEDYYYNCSKFSDFIVLCCDFVKEHRKELTDEEMFALYNISGASMNIVLGASNDHKKITDFLVKGYLNNYFTKNGEEILRLTGGEKNKNEDGVIKNCKASVGSSQIFLYNIESRYANMVHFTRDDLNPPMYYIYAY